MTSGVTTMKIKATLVLKYFYDGELIEVSGSYESVQEFFQEVTAEEHYNEGSIEDIEVSYGGDYVPTVVGFDDVQDFFEV